MAIENIQTLLDLGLSAILLVMLWFLWKDRKEEREQSQATISEKDQHIRNLNAEVLNVVKENTKTQVELRSSVKENTKATETLTSRIYDLMSK